MIRSSRQSREGLVDTALPNYDTIPHLGAEDGCGCRGDDDDIPSLSTLPAPTCTVQHASSLSTTARVTQSKARLRSYTINMLPVQPCTNKKSPSPPSALGLSGPIEAASSLVAAAPALSNDLEAVEDDHSTIDPLQEQWLEEQSLFEASSESEEEDQCSDNEGICYKEQACLITIVSKRECL